MTVSSFIKAHNITGIKAEAEARQIVQTLRKKVQENTMQMTANPKTLQSPNVQNQKANQNKLN